MFTEVLRFRRWLTGFVVAISIGVSTSSAVDFTAWKNSAKIYLNTSSTGANVSGPVTNFPFLVRLNPTNFVFSSAKSGGDDIRFSKADGTTALPYQIERWDNTANAEIWVKVDTVKASDASQYIIMYWNNSGAPAASSGPAVFDTTNGFVAAYHLAENTGAGAADATINGLNGTRAGTPAQITGVIGTGQTFDGSGDYFQTGTFDKGQFGAAFTMSGWVNVPGGVAGPGGMWSKGNADGTWAANRVQFFLGAGTAGSAQAGRIPGMVGYDRNWIVGNTAISPDVWHYITYQYNPLGPVRAIYVDGVLQGLNNQGFFGNDNTGDLFFIGRRISADVNTDFNGKMDEVVMSKTVRSADWIKLSYENQKSGSTVVCVGPRITTQPSNVEKLTGDTATFTVAANGTGLSYQWQRGVVYNGVLNWGNVTAGVGGTTATYKFQTAFATDSNTQYRCIISTCGPDTSNAVTLAVCNRTAITTQPVNATGVNVGDSATFTVAASGSGVIHQWQRLRSGGSWTALSGQRSTTCRVKIDSVDTTSRYRCVDTGASACGNSLATSNEVTVQVCFPPIITTQPANQGVLNGQTATFSVGASGRGTLTYQWQRLPVGSSTWGNIDLQTGTTYSKTVAPADSGAKFRCVVSASPCGSTPSASAMISSCSLPVVTSDPASQTVIVGDTARFSVTANNAIGYQWQKSVDKGASWTNISGAVLLGYNFKTTAADSIRVRCVVSGGCSGFDTSAAAILTLCNAVGITTQPVTQTVTAGVNAVFTIVAGGTGLTYQWQRQENSGSTWAPIGLANTASYTLTTTIPSAGNVSPDSGAKFRCVVTSTCGGTMPSNIAIVNVNTTPIIIRNPSDTSVTVGNTAVFNIQARGTITSYQWQKTVNSGTSWSNVTVGTGGTSSVYSFPTTASDTVTGVQFRCVVTGPSGSTTSGIGRIGLCFPAAILTNPLSDTVTSGDQATFSVTATGTGLNFQWEKDTGAGTWAAIPSATNANYGFNVVAANNNWRLHCIVSGSCGTPQTSAVAVLSVCSPIAIAGNPRDTIVSLGANATFRVSATGTAPTYQWQRSRNAGTSWTNVTGASATTPNCTVPADTADTGALFHCVVTGGCGVAISGPARLTICFPFTIPVAGQPANQLNISPGERAVFQVRPSGIHLAYQWERKAPGSSTWTAIAGKTAFNYSLLVAYADNNVLFRCRVSDTCTVRFSDSALLTVCAAPVVTRQPDSPRVIVTQPAQFTITATGTDLKYQWQRMDSGSSTWNSIPGDTSPVYTIDSTKITDNNARFRCKIKGQCDSTISNDARLSVFVKAKAQFSMAIDGKPDSIAPAPVTVRFTDLSSGAISTWSWSFGDGKSLVDSTRGVIRDYAFTTPAAYAVRLIVQGPGGTDTLSRTLTVYSKTGNPIFMSGSYMSADSSVALVYRNFDSLKAAPLNPPTVDSIRLWYRLGGLPDTLGNAKLLKSYTLAAFKAKGSVFSDNVKIDMTGSSFSTSGFMTQIIWNDGRTTPFDSINGFVVTMRDTLRPKNRLSVSGTYAPWDTVTFYLDSVQMIDSVSDSVGLWYGIGQDSVPDFVNSANPNVHWWKKDSIIAAAKNNRFECILKNSLFNTGTSDLNCAVVIKGKNKLFSNIRQAKVFIGRERPKNPIALHAARDPAASSIINLMWDRYTVADSVEKIRIYYRTGSAIDTGRYDFSGLQLSSIEVTPLGLGDTVRPVKNLEAKTRYYFGAQVYKNGMWSIVTAAACATDSTDTAGTSTIRNTIRINPVVFDSATNRLHVSWSLDTAGMSGLYVGYSFSAKGGNPGNTTARTVGNGVTSDTGSMVLDLGDSLLFNTDYYVYLWLKKENEKWAPPTDSSTDTVTIPPFVWQSVHYNFTIAGETSYWASGMIRFVTPPVLATQKQDRAGEIFKFIDTITDYAGFINVSQSFYFKVKQQSQQFEIALKSSRPDSLKMTFIYRFDTASGRWLVDTNTKRDTVNGYVYLVTSQLDMPFAALIDIQPPTVRLVDTSTVPVKKNDTVSYTVAVADNAGNVQWTFQSTKGGFPYSSGKSVDGKATGGIDMAHVSIDVAHVSDDNGAMARFIATDGRFSDTIDLSRRVIRLKSDASASSGMKWVPLRVTAELDSAQAGRLLRFIDTINPTPRYNDVYARLFRRYPDSSNITEQNRWREYTRAPDSLFDFVSGRLLWLKTRTDGVKIDFGTGVTMSQTVPVTVPLFAHEWTDFALPYRYNMRVGDIIAATRDAGAYADSLQMYNWTIGKDGIYGSQPFYVPKIGVDKSERIMSFLGDTLGFTVFNPSNRTVNLIIPPISENMPAYRSSAAKNKSIAGTNTVRWAIKVLPTTADGAILTTVYCGFTANPSEGRIFYPVAPSFNNVSISAFDENSGVASGHKMATDMKAGGCSYLLMFTNAAKTSQTVSITLGQSGAFPSAMKIAAYDPLTGETADMSSSGSELSVPLEGEGRAFRWLLVGDAQYIANAVLAHAGGKLALTSVYPNPLRRFAHLLYTLPFGKVANVDFTVVDIMGKTIWHKSIKEHSVFGGRRDYVWYGTSTTGHRVAAGVYILKMSAFDAKGKSVGNFERRLTILP